MQWCVTINEATGKSNYLMELDFRWKVIITVLSYHLQFSAREIVENLVQMKHTEIAMLCVAYALDLVDDIPNDERWNTTGQSLQTKNS